MHKETPAWLPAELQWGLRETSAPPELWDRICAAEQIRPAPRRQIRPVLVWATAAVVVIVAGLTAAYRQSAGSDRVLALRALNGTSGMPGFRCENPAQLRAWVRANTGLDLPLRADASRSIQLIGAQEVKNSRGVEIAYRAGDSAAVLLVSRVNSDVRNSAHDQASGSVSSWVMDGQRYTLACDNPADLQLACKLCHID